MSVEQFTVQSASIVGIIALAVLVFTGIILLVLAGKRARTVRRGFAVLLIVGIAVIGVGVYLFFASNTPSTITVGSILAEACPFVYCFSEVLNIRES